MFPPGQSDDPDASIRGTDSDALLARLSAVKKGYLVDPFIHHFATRPHLQPPRPPLIDIGTYVRTTGIDQLVEKWIELCSRAGQRCQIVSFGAGSDTRFWRLSSGGKAGGIVKYIEIDFQEITAKKAMIIKKHKDLISPLGDPANVSLANGGTSLNSPVYHLFAVDLRQDPSTTLGSLLSGDVDAPLLDPSVPTLLLFECVLCYMLPEKSERLLRWFRQYFQPSTAVGCIIYEMFGLNDPFGRVMKSNLMARNVELPGAEPFQTRNDLHRRLDKLGFTISAALNMDTTRTECIPKSELQRISKLEMLDEIEELRLVLSHYAIAWGVFAPDAERQKWLEWSISPAVNSEESDT